MSARTVIVTGGSSGIGLAIAKTLSAGGDRVHVFARRSAQEFAEAAGELASAVTYHSLDVRDERAPQRLREIAGQHGFDVLINCAGVMSFENAPDSSAASIAEHVSVNLSAPMLLCATAAAIWQEHPSPDAHIVNVSSVAALRPTPKLAVYAGAKAGLLHYSRSLAAELAGQGVRVNVVCPGAVATGLAPRVHFKLIERTVPLKRLQQADEVASMVSWLLSSAARNVTGSVFTLDGGMSL